MKYFLAKSDPEEYGIDDLERDKVAEWDGVRNPAAVLVLKSMKHGDRVLIYHSQGEKTIVGLVEVTGDSRPDPKDPKSWLVKFKFIRKFNEPHVTLSQIKQSGLFGKDAGDNAFRLTYQSRLSTMHVPQGFIEWLKKQSGIDLS
jgi:predicted RNA-binding protein with PUA-like domain